MMGSLDLAERRIHTLIRTTAWTFSSYLGRAHGDRGAADARRDRGDPRRRLHLLDTIEDDGITDRDYPIELTPTIEGDEVIADFTGRRRWRSAL